MTVPVILLDLLTLLYDTLGLSKSYYSKEWIEIFICVGTIAFLSGYIFAVKKCLFNRLLRTGG